MKIIEKILFVIVLLVLLLPAIQQQWSMFPESRPLTGDFIPARAPEFTWANWYNSKFQDQLEPYLKDRTGFGTFLIRFRNQMDYSLFDRVHAEGVIKGKQEDHFEYDYIRAYTGIDFVGKQIIDRKIRRLKFLQTFLKDSLDIDLHFVIEPDKASLYPERIPDKYLKMKKPVTNYRMILEKSKQYDLPVVNLNNWFIQIKDQVRYPLYGRFAAHWSEYASYFAMDSLLNLIGQTRQITFPEVLTADVDIQDYARPIDYDIGRALNLLVRYKNSEPLAYPELKIAMPDAGLPSQLSLLVVADSYYWNIHNTRIPDQLFQPEKYWYFGKVIFPESYTDTIFTDALNMQKAIENKDVILLMTTGRFLYKFDWYLTDRLYEIYGVQSEYDQSFRFLQNILYNEEWFRFSIQEAKRKGIPLEEQLMDNARYLYREKDPFRYNVMHLLPDIEETIRKDASWLKDIERKAREKNLTVDEMVRIDAEYLMALDHPEVDSVRKALQKQKEFLLQYPEQRAMVEKEAEYYRISFEEMLQIRAEQRMDR